MNKIKLIVPDNDPKDVYDRDTFLHLVSGAFKPTRTGLKKFIKKLFELSEYGEPQKMIESTWYDNETLRTTRVVYFIHTKNTDVSYNVVVEPDTITVAVYTIESVPSYDHDNYENEYFLDQTQSIPAEGISQFLIPAISSFDTAEEISKRKKEIKEEKRRQAMRRAVKGHDLEAWIRIKKDEEMSMIDDQDIKEAILACFGSETIGYHFVQDASGYKVYSAGSSAVTLADETEGFHYCMDANLIGEGQQIGFCVVSDLMFGADPKKSLDYERCKGNEFIPRICKNAEPKIDPYTPASDDYIGIDMQDLTIFYDNVSADVDMIWNNVEAEIGYVDPEEGIDDSVAEEAYDDALKKAYEDAIGDGALWAQGKIDKGGELTLYIAGDGSKGYGLNLPGEEGIEISLTKTESEYIKKAVLESIERRKIA